MGLINQEWIIPDPVTIQPDQWIEEVLGVRKWKMEESTVAQQFPRSLDGASKRIIVPILCLKRTPTASASLS